VANPPNEPLLSVRGLTCGVNGRTLFGGIDLTLAAGDLVEVRGPNGSGKTTLLRCIAGLFTEESGSVRVSPPERPLYLGHKPGVNPMLSALENIRWYLALEGLSRNAGVCRDAIATVWLRGAGHAVTGIDSAAGPLSRALERRIREAGIGRADVPEPPAGAPNTLPDAAVIASEPALAEADVVFLALHGGAGEDGTIQTLLEVSGIPYAGSGPVACALAMNKDLTKRLLRDAGVPTPDWIAGAEAGDVVAGRLGLPVIVKPVSGGSSVRLTLARTAAEVDEATAVAAGGGDTVMYEAYVSGGEFTVGILDGAPLPVVEIQPVRELFDFDCKYEAGMALEIAPARIGPGLTGTLQRRALEVHRLLGMEHFSRVDFMVDGDGKAWCLEANALPGLTGNSLLPKAARAAGIEFPQLCERICRLGSRKGSRGRR